mgnify:CR=1 FL=1
MSYNNNVLLLIFIKNIKSFDKIIKYSDEHCLLKYKFLLHISLTDENQKFVAAREMQKFFRMIRCDKKNEILNEEIISNILNFYSIIYKKENPKKFPVDKLILLLEFFFENK